METERCGGWRVNIMGYVSFSTNASDQRNFAWPEWAVRTENAQEIAKLIGNACHRFGVGRCLIHNYPGAAQLTGMVLEQRSIVNAGESERLKWAVTDQEIMSLVNSLRTNGVEPVIYLGGPELNGPSSFTRWDHIGDFNTMVDLFDQALRPWLETGVQLVFDATGPRAPGSLSHRLYAWLSTQCSRRILGVEHAPTPQSFGASREWTPFLHQYNTSPLVEYHRRRHSDPFIGSVGSGRWMMVEDFGAEARADIVSQLAAGNGVCIPLDVEHPERLPMGLTAAQLAAQRGAA